MGYIGWSMSERASECYENGIMPLSKWSKKAILFALEDILEEVEEEYGVKLNLDEISTLTQSELKTFVLKYDSWHHTSSKYNKTDFYALDTESISKLSSKKITDIKKQSKTRLEELRNNKEPKEEETNLYVSALVTFDYWTGTRKHPKKEFVETVVFYREKDKMVNCGCPYGNKRKSSLSIVFEIKQKTKYVSEEQIMKKHENHLKQQNIQWEWHRKIRDKEIMLNIVPSKHITSEMCASAVWSNPENLKYVPKDFISENLIHNAYDFIKENEDILNSNYSDGMIENIYNKINQEKEEELEL